MNEYIICFNGSCWTCDVINENGEVICSSEEDSPMEALKDAIDSE